MSNPAATGRNAQHCMYVEFIRLHFPLASTASLGVAGYTCHTPLHLFIAGAFWVTKSATAALTCLQEHEKCDSVCVNDSCGSDGMCRLPGIIGKELNTC